MGKLYTPTPISNIYSSVNTINQNWDDIEDALDLTLSRDGSTPNQMNALIDMNSNDIINAGSVHMDDLIVDGLSLGDQVLAAANSASQAANSASQAANSASQAANSATLSEQYADEAKAASETVMYVPDIAALRALTGVQDGQAVRMTTTGRAGDFYFNAADLSAETSADPQSGIYVAPTSDATGTSGAWVRQIPATGVSPEMFGAVGNGSVDDSGALLGCLSVADALSLWVELGEATYLLSTWTTQAFNNIRITGKGCDLSTIDAGNRAIDIFSLNINGSVDLRDVHFKGANRVVVCDQDAVLVSSIRCKYSNMRRSPIHTLFVETLLPFTETIRLVDNIVENSPGFIFESGIGSAVAYGNYMDGVRRDQSIWNDTSYTHIIGIQFGYTDDIATTDNQERTSNIKVIGNTIKNVYNFSDPDDPINPAPAKVNTQAIMATGYNVVIADNTIEDVNAVQKIDCTGIYTKAYNLVISGNTLIDAGADATSGEAAEGCIQIKGVSPGSGIANEGYNAIVSNNVIMSKSRILFKGIGCNSPYNTKISGNIIQGTIKGISFTSGDLDRVSVVDNEFINIQGTLPIHVSCPSVSGLTIRGNSVTMVGNAYDNEVYNTSAYGIFVRATGSAKKIRIEDNSISLSLPTGSSLTLFRPVLIRTDALTQDLSVSGLYAENDGKPLSFVYGVVLDSNLSGLTPHFDGFSVRNIRLKEASATIRPLIVDGAAASAKSSLIANYDASELYSNGSQVRPGLPFEVQRGVAYVDAFLSDYSAIGSYSLGAFKSSVTVTKVELFIAGSISGSAGAKIGIGIGSTANRDIYPTTDITTMPSGGNFAQTSIDGNFATFERYYGENDIYLSVLDAPLTNGRISMKIYFDYIPG